MVIQIQNKIRHDWIRGQVDMTYIDEKMVEDYLRWFDLI